MFPETSNELRNYTKKDLESKRPFNIIHEIERLIIAQHYGVKTRLLDWTTNPLIALWFACNDYEKANQQKKYAVYVHIPEWIDDPENFSDYNDYGNEFTGKSPDRKLAFQNPFCLNIPTSIHNNLTPFKEIHFIRPAMCLDVRIYKQSSILSIHPNFKKKITPYCKYEIKKEDANKIMYELNILGINFITSGLATRDSIAQRVNESV